MKIFSIRLFVLALVGTAWAASYIAPNGVALAAVTARYSLTSTMKLGGEGGWDYATLDKAGKFLYVTRTSHTMVVTSRRARRCMISQGRYDRMA
jgi:hypothetical protein